MFDIDEAERHIAAYAETVNDVDWSKVDMSIAARVDRGFTYLSTVYGEDVYRIDPFTLNIESDGHCALGQLWGGYGMSPESDRFGAAWLRAHGFVPSNFVLIDGAPDCLQLNARWAWVLTFGRSRK